MKFVIHPASDRLAIAPERREPIPPTWTRPDDRVKASVDSAGFGERSVQMPAKVLVATLCANEIREHEQRLRL
jgi:hypothetical protein